MCIPPPNYFLQCHLFPMETEGFNHIEKNLSLYCDKNRLSISLLNILQLYYIYILYLESDFYVPLIVTFLESNSNRQETDSQILGLKSLGPIDLWTKCPHMNHTYDNNRKQISRRHKDVSGGLCETTLFPQWVCSGSL